MRIQEVERRSHGRWLLLSAGAAIALFAAGPIPRHFDQEPPAAARAHAARRAVSAQVDAARDAIAGAAAVERRIEGFVTCLDGPVPGLRVAAVDSSAGIDPASVAASFTGADGGFHVRKVPKNARQWIALGARGDVLEGPDLVAEHDLAPLHWELPWRRVSVRLRDAAGRAIAGCPVECTTHDGAKLFAVRHCTDANGLCVALVQDATEIEIRATPAGRSTITASFAVTATTQNWTIILR